MKDETKLRLAYAQDNLASALVLLESDLFNPCLQKDILVSSCFSFNTSR